MGCDPVDGPDDLPIAELRARYLSERARRLRPEGTGQYAEAADDLASYWEADPHSPPIRREPISEEVEVAVLGGGFAGLIIASRLKQAGVDDLRIIEMAGDFGGTWYWNRYPGVQCDVESFSYMPMLEELGYIPSHRYAFGAEIYEHCRRIADRFDLYRHALFGTQVRNLRWDEAAARWHLVSDRGDHIHARFVVMACGVLNRPKLPGIAGIADFQGHSFHTSRWDYDYTGGNAEGGLTGLADKRVAVIGTGASGVQVIPHLGRDTGHLYVFQRTPSAVFERDNRPTDPAWAAALRPGWQAARQESFQKVALEGLTSIDQDLICDGWGQLSRGVADRIARRGDAPISVDEIAEIRRQEDYRVMERLRRRIDSIVTDRATADLLKPWFHFMCKRPCFNDAYLDTFNRPNVTLVDVSAAQGVERVTERGIVANGIEYPVDCIIYASGFEVTNDHRRRFGIGVIVGRGGRSLFEHWRNGYRTFHGLMAHGFPNLFFTGFTQNAVTAAHNLIYEQQARQIVHIVTGARARGAARAEPSAAAEDDWVRAITEQLNLNADFTSECTPGYYNNEGTGNRLSPLFGEPFGQGAAVFDALLREWREAGDLDGLDLQPA